MVKGQYQGAVFRFAQGLEVGINRMEWGPDGALYVAGLGGAQDFGHRGHSFGLQRLTYNGKTVFEMLAIRAKSNGLEIQFTKPLRIGDGTHPEDYKVQQWHYKWTDEGPSQEKRDLENLKIKSVTLSDDRKNVFLELVGMELEWKLESGAEGGILFNVPHFDDAEKTLAVSPRMQLVDDQGNADAKVVREHKTGANYDVSEPKYVVSKPANEYNKARIVVKGNHVEHWVNGIIVTDYQLLSKEWKASLSGTIYENVEDYCKAWEGLIALYSKQGNIWVRNVRLRELEDAL